MNNDLTAGQRWSTRTFAADAQVLARELAALGEHLELCRAASGRLFSLRCSADAVHCFIAPRFVTTLVVAVLLIGISLSLG